jgi:DNA-binding MarR family transcriptional regulator
MQHRALLERTPAPRDGRGACITITGAGRRAIEAAAEGHAADVRRWFLEPVGRDLAVLRAVSERLTGRGE